ncbi:hypothetical protein BJ742DRAFT_751952 [Cladochytrium replicatum]|nr:hypothetical protein BJ742DRAFT_751952 [Cladochytrium replicatum]
MSGYRRSDRDTGRGGYSDSRDGYGGRGSNDVPSGYDSRGGYRDSRGGYDDSRRGYGDSRGGYDDSRRGYSDSRGYGDDSRSGSRGDSRGDSRGGYGGDSRGSPQVSRDRWAAAAAAAENGHDNRPGYRNWEAKPEETDDLEYLQERTREVQNESLASTRRALNRIYETENIAQSSMSKLHSQSEQLQNVENRLDAAGQQIKISDSKANELKSLQRSFLLPVFGGGKKAAKKKEEEFKRQEEERKAKEEDSRRAEEDRRNRWREDYDRHAKGSQPNPNGAGRSYSTPQGLERDHAEQEIDNNLDQISSALGRLKFMGESMNTELDSQMGRLNRIDDKTNSAQERLARTHKKVEAISKRA